MTQIDFKLRDKITGEDMILEFKTSRNPVRMAINLTRMVNKLKKYDKTHNLVQVFSLDKNLEKLFKKEIKRQEISIDKTGEVALPEGMPDLTPSGLRKRASEWIKRRSDGGKKRK